MNIKCLKTVTGEDIIAEITNSISGDAIILTKPCAIVMIPTSNTQFSVGLAPYMPYTATREFRFDNRNIVLVTDPSQELKNEYLRIIGAGIVVPKNDLSIIR